MDVLVPSLVLLLVGRSDGDVLPAHRAVVRDVGGFDHVLVHIRRTADVPVAAAVAAEVVNRSIIRRGGGVEERGAQAAGLRAAQMADAVGEGGVGAEPLAGNVGKGV